MAELKSDLMRTLVERGFVKDATDLAALDVAAMEGPLTTYTGFDATAPSLHVGSLIQIMVMRHLLTNGHRPMILLGHATTLIGDPSDKDEQRPLLGSEAISKNASGISAVFDQLGLHEVQRVSNLDWFAGLGFLEFLREFGPHFTVNRMLTMDSVKRRLGRQQPLTVLEFNYQLMQSIDFLQLARHHDCIVQIGGSDQWSNILGGVELARRVDSRQTFGIVTPLMTNMAGEKMGKTAGGQTVWLDASRTSVFDFWQFWRNAEDGKVAEFLALFTDLPMDEVCRLGALEGAKINEAKRILATEVTAIVHGRKAAEEAANAASAIFEKKTAHANMPTVAAPWSIGEGATSVATLLVHAGLANSKAAAKRLIEGGGVRVNGSRLAEDRIVEPDDFPREGLQLTAGKKRHVLITLHPSVTP